MRVVFKTPILTFIIEAKRDADENLRQIDCIEMNAKEIHALRREAADMAMFPSRHTSTPTLFDPGRIITAGDTALVYGVKIVCTESAPRIDLSKACDMVVSVTRG